MWNMGNDSYGDFSSLDRAFRMASPSPSRKPSSHPCRGNIRCQTYTFDKAHKKGQIYSWPFRQWIISTVRPSNQKTKNRPSLTGAERFLNTSRAISDQHPIPLTSFQQKQN